LGKAERYRSDMLNNAVYVAIALQYVRRTVLIERDATEKFEDLLVSQIPLNA
jgi:hypothetical protein